MASFTPEIRKYLATDPYYYEVDNIPIEQLQENTIHNLDRILALEETSMGWATEQWVKIWAADYFAKTNHLHSIQKLNNVSDAAPEPGQVIAFDSITSNWIPSSIIIPSEGTPFKDTFIFEDVKFVGETENLYAGGQNETNWYSGYSSSKKTFVLDSIPPGDRIHTAYVYLRFTNIRSSENGHTLLQLFPDGLEAQEWPRVNIPGGGPRILIAGKRSGDHFTSHSYECLVPVRYVSETDEIMIRLKVAGAYLVFENYGELQFTGQYVTKEKKEVVIG